MISVFIGDYHYKYNGDGGIITNTLIGNSVLLSKKESQLCNKSNLNITSTIVKHLTWLKGE
jgi:hypothetical protein